MSEVIIHDHSIHEPTVSQQHPTKTTPQGTQEHGVPNGHEHRDIHIRALLTWFASLAVSVVVVVLLMWGTYAAFNYRENQVQAEMMPSRVFSEEMKQYEGTGKDFQAENKPEPR